MATDKFEKSSVVSFDCYGTLIDRVIPGTLATYSRV
jgi:hypothetical protein